jgi:hypothetical protein
MLALAASAAFEAVRLDSGWVVFPGSWSAGTRHPLMVKAPAASASIQGLDINFIYKVSKKVVGEDADRPRVAGDPIQKPSQSMSFLIFKINIIC